MFYTPSFLFMVIVLLPSLVASNFIAPLTGLMLSLVYGAIIIPIGYVCAISPNLTTSSAISPSIGGRALTLARIFFTFPTLPLSFVLRAKPTLFSYLYGSGYQLLVIIALILFVTLLIVTCQYPQGRSVRYKCSFFCSCSPVYCSC